MGEPLPSLTSRPLSRPASALLSAAGDVFEDVAKDVGDVLGKAFKPVGKAIGALDIPTPNVNIGVSDTVYAGIRARNAASAARGVQSYHAGMEAQTARDQAKNAADESARFQRNFDARDDIIVNAQQIQRRENDFLGIDFVKFTDTGNSVHFKKYADANNDPINIIDLSGAQACAGVKGLCVDSSNFKVNKSDNQTVIQSPNIDAAASQNLPNFESIGNIENAVRFDEDSFGNVTTTQLRVETKVKRGLLETTVSGVSGAEAIGHSHPNDTTDISGGPRDYLAVNAGFPNNIVHDGNVSVIEKVNGQFRIRVLTDNNLTMTDMNNMQKDVNSYQRKVQ